MKGLGVIMIDEQIKRLIELLNDENNKEIKATSSTWDGEEYDYDDDDDWDCGTHHIATFGECAIYKDEAIRDEIEELCCDLFIGSNGHPVYDHIKKFEHMSGYEVGPGESDGFGWLTGVVSKGDTMYICFG